MESMATVPEDRKQVVSVENALIATLKS